MPLFPFNVYADSITSANIIGINRVNVSSTHVKDTTVTVQGLGQITLSQFEYEYEITVLLDDYYLGYINGSFSTSLNDVYWGTGEIYNRTASKQNMSYYVNGNSFTTSFTIIANMRNIQGGGNIDPTSSYSTTFSLNTSNVTKYQDLNSIDTVIDILQDVSQYVSVDILDELQNIVDELELSNDYLETISKLRQYYFPTESLSAMVRAVDPYYIKLGTTELLDFAFGRWTYPLVKITHPNEDWIIFQNIIYKDHPIDIVFWAQSTRSANTWQNDFRIQNPSDFQVLKVERLAYTNIMGLDGDDTNNAKGFGLFHFQIAYVGNSAGNNFYFLAIKNPIYYVPIFCGLADNVGTDFALEYGLENQILRNLNIIAQGTQQSNQSGENLEDSAADITTNSNTMFQFENQQNTNMNNALQSINTNFDIGTIGSSFLSSAAWVKTQFDNLTNTTPFGSVLSFSLLLGLALLIIGKVYK